MAMFGESEVTLILFFSRLALSLTARKKTVSDMNVIVLTSGTWDAQLKLLLMIVYTSVSGGRFSF